MDTIEKLKNREEMLWLNPDLKSVEPMEKINDYGFVHMKAAQNRFMRFLPYVASVFPETAAKKGIIESELIPLSAMKDWLNSEGAGIEGQILLKDDARLPIAGSVKARGGIHEVMKIAEMLAQEKKQFLPTENYAKLDSPEFRDLFSAYKIQVGSTGNLGISIGRMATRMGFQAIVHMSSDAKAWKKDLLRREGVIVKEYDGDYSHAVAAGRRESAEEENSFFVDDENSKDLFFGYSTAAMRVSVQLRKKGIPVDGKHPLFLYLPCGVGGAPGGITFGFKQMFGDHVHCFFAEPVEAPCFTLGMASRKKEKISVSEIGLSGRTLADGLAVGRPSSFACRMMEPLVAGSFTVSDEHLLEYQKALLRTEDIFLEPSACAGFRGLMDVCRPDSGWERYIKSRGLTESMDRATHIVWGTGGGLMPREEFY